jgi:hypothetical protein
VTVPFELLFSVKQARKVDFSDLVLEQLRGSGKERINGGIGWGNALLNAGA